ncbi:MAG: 3-deoxy-manno-octulosonate cytidylyltransferase [Hyphomicrobiaceae bacterium]|nr:3-deoxy-manno-octulosonate cytidylyltransferase [Hyphomicrobiaceae bacterium]
MPQTLIVIPARLQASRLPGKPLKDICGEPMIVHVWRRAVEADAGRVLVATDSEGILKAIEQAGGEAVMTKSDHESGTDRVFEAVEAVDGKRSCDIVVNLQGDLPTLDPGLVSACIAPLTDDHCDIATLAVEIVDEAERDDPHVVKAIGTRSSVTGTLRALYFTRATAPHGEGPLYHHIGIYAFRRAALQRFVSLPRSELECREKLEQLRALEAGMRIDVALVDTVPVGVDTPADLERARALLSSSAH